MRVAFFTILSNTSGSVPYGPCALAAYLSQERDKLRDCIEIKLLAAPYSQNPREMAERITAMSPDVVAVSLYIWNYLPMMKLLPMLRVGLPTAKILLGGPHVSVGLDQLSSFLRDGVVDALISGEGETALIDALGEISNGALSAHKTGEPVASLDTLPNPYLSDPFLLADLRRTKTAIVEGSRGCPYRCTFCDQGWRKARARSLDLIKSDLTSLYSQGARLIYFLDPTFNYQPPRMRELLNFIRESLPGLKISAEIKVDRLGPDDIEAMRGVVAFVEAGLQTTNPNTLARIHRPEKIDRVWANIQCLKQAGVLVVVNTIFGLPGETLDDWYRSIDDCFAQTEIMITSTCLKILPNTEIDSCKASYEYEWDETRLFRATRSSTMSREDFVKAEVLSRRLRQVQTARDGLPQHQRTIIKNRYGNALSAYLRSEGRPIPAGFAARPRQGALSNGA